MIVDAALAFAHFVLVFIVVGTLTAEAYMLRLPLTRDTVKAIARADLLYGISAAGLIAAGVARVFFGAKPAAFYWSSHSFWGKMAVFVIIGAISAIPTLKFIAWRKRAAADPAFVPPEAEVRTMRRIVTAEVHLLALVILFAVLMARGIG